MKTGRSPQSEQALGTALGTGAYLFWGLFPVYFHLLDAVAPIEIVAHRIFWSLAFLAIVVTVLREWANVRSVARSPRSVGLLTVAALLLSTNWLVYVYAVSIDEVVQASLGYLINPLISVALGVVFLKERLRTLQWASIVLAIIAILVLTVSYGHPPWISFALALSFGFYGFVKKQVGADSVTSLFVETAVLTPVAILIFVLGTVGGGTAASHDGAGIFVMLMLLGPITAVPLIAFGAAANRIPLSLLGLLQYLTPVFQFILGVVYFHDPMPTSRWIGFAIIAVSLVILSVDTLEHSRRPPALLAASDD